MKTILTIVVAMTIGCAGFALLHAQETAAGLKAAQAARESSDAVRNLAILGPPTTGAPFSAVVIVEDTRTLGDGNRISQTQSAKFYRDSQGRERSERAAEGSVVRIGDPVANVSYRLDAQDQTAVQGFPSSFPLSPLNRSLARPKLPARPMPAGSTSVIEDLGTETIEGVTTQHTRSTITEPPGRLGNEKPLVWAEENWYSPELKMSVMSRRSNPQSGDEVFRLTQITRGDPDPALFQVPKGYTLTVTPGTNQFTYAVPK